jgi:hypothetical protein
MGTASLLQASELQELDEVQWIVTVTDWNICYYIIKVLLH